MSLESIVAEIDLEISRLQQAKQLLGGGAKTKGPGRPRGKSVAVVADSRRKRTLSASARAKIAAAQKARWAKVKKIASKSGATKPEAK